MGEPRYKLPYDFRTISRGLEPLEDAVTDFHEKYRLPIGDKRAPKALNAERLALRLKMFREEVDELELAQYDKRPLVGMVDACIDIIYHAVGALVEMGVEPGPMTDEVHRSNMSKLGPDGQPLYREDGKVLKGPDYDPPDIAGAIDAQTDYYGLLRDSDVWGEGETLF